MWCLQEQIYKAFENDIKQETAKNKAIFMIQKGKIAIDENILPNNILRIFLI